MHLLTLTEALTDCVTLNGFPDSFQSVPPVSTNVPASRNYVGQTEDEYESVNTAIWLG